MIPFADLVQRWGQKSVVPVFVGSVPEGTLPPYASFNVVQSNIVPLNGSQSLWTETLIQFNAVTNTLADSEALAAVAIGAFNFQKFNSVVDMTLLNRTATYSESPTLTGNRVWTATLEFRIRH